MIKEVIVVEGKDDMSAVKRACQAEIIITGGLGLTQDTLERIRTAQRRCGVIVLTDPDYPGEKIRHMINEAVPGCRHAYLREGQGRNKEGKAGVEYCEPGEIWDALARARCSQATAQACFTIRDLYEHGLAGHPRSGGRRLALCQDLGLGNTNAKQLLGRLNAYGITREEFARAISALKEE